MKAFWEARYGEPGYAYGTAANAFLVEQAGLFEPGQSVLAVADGEGRNGVWLAGRGLDVLSVDQSEIGLRKARELALRRGVALRTEQADLVTWDWPVNAFDRLIAIFIHFLPEHRVPMHRAMLAALKPGGLLLMEAFRPEQLEYRTGGPPLGEMLYSLEMLREDFAGTELLACEERVTELDEGPYHRGPAAVVRLIARKPSD